MSQEREVAMNERRRSYGCRGRSTKQAVEAEVLRIAVNVSRRIDDHINNKALNILVREVLFMEIPRSRLVQLAKKHFPECTLED
jgi:hypothetical protein